MNHLLYRMSSSLNDLDLPAATKDGYLESLLSFSGFKVTMLIVFTVVIIYAMILLTRDYRKEQAKSNPTLGKTQFKMIITSFVVLYIAAIALTGVISQKTSLRYNASERIKTIEYRAYENILKKYDLDKVDPKDVKLWGENGIVAITTDVKMKKAEISYNDLETATHYDLNFVFDGNDPILMKTATVNQELIEKLEK